MSRWPLRIALFMLAGVTFGTPGRAEMAPEEVLRNWYKLGLELVRHTPTYTPPVASRTFAYLGVTAFEAVLEGTTDLETLAGQLNGLEAGPRRQSGAVYDEAVVVDAAMEEAVTTFFSNTGPTGQRAMAALGQKTRDAVTESVPADVVARSEEFGRAVAAHILDWSATDGGAVVENMGFPYEYALNDAPGHWVPTNQIVQQQKPLLPYWGSVRTFALPQAATCDLPPPPAYSEEEGSEFYLQAMEVFDIKAGLTPEQRAVARFWSDDPMLSTTPPGHWISIALQVLDQQNADLATTAETLAKVGIAVADGFIGCWQTKYEYDLLRPVTYIRKTMDPKWESLLNTPPFPEYPSGHSTQSAAAATVLTSLFGENFAFEDSTPVPDGLKPRSFPSFAAAAEEAALSRLYGGIHFRAAIERGLEQGRCIGAYASALQTRRQE